MVEEKTEKEKYEWLRDRCIILFTVGLAIVTLCFVLDIV